MSLDIVPDAPPRRTHRAPSSSRSTKGAARLVGGGLALVVVIVVVAVVVMRHGSKSVPKLPVEAPVAVLANAKAAALAQGNVYVTTTSTGSGRVAQQTDIAQSGMGLQHTTSSRGTTSVYVDGDVTYYQADRSGLLNYYGATAASATQNANHWFRLTSADKGYADVTAAVTVPSLMQEIGLTGPLTRLPVVTLQGVRVFGIRGRSVSAVAGVQDTATVWIRADGSGLPVEFEDVGVDSAQDVVLFSRWGQVGATIANPVPRSVTAS